MSECSGPPWAATVTATTTSSVPAEVKPEYLRHVGLQMRLTLTYLGDREVEVAPVQMSRPCAGSGPSHRFHSMIGDYRVHRTYGRKRIPIRRSIYGRIGAAAGSDHLAR